MPKLLHKAAGIIIQDNSLLVLRSLGNTLFFAPGGKLERHETPRQALVRELSEEISIEVDEAKLRFFSTFTAPAAGREEITLCMDVFVVQCYEGLISPRNEIAECCWINSGNIDSIEIGSIFRDQVFPRLLSAGQVQ